MQNPASTLVTQHVSPLRWYVLQSSETPSLELCLAHFSLDVMTLLEAFVGAELTTRTAAATADRRRWVPS